MGAHHDQVRIAGVRMPSPSVRLFGDHGSLATNPCAASRSLIRHCCSAALVRCRSSACSARKPRSSRRRFHEFLDDVQALHTRANRLATVVAYRTVLRVCAESYESHPEEAINRLVDAVSLALEG